MREAQSFRTEQPVNWQEEFMTLNVERRHWSRLDQLFPVLVESNAFGFKNCVARNVSKGGMFLETREPLPLGSMIRVYFALPQTRNGISATGKVNNHYYFPIQNLENILFRISSDVTFPIISPRAYSAFLISTARYSPESFLLIDCLAAIKLFFALLRAL